MLTSRGHTVTNNGLCNVQLFTLCTFFTFLIFGSCFLYIADVKYHVKDERRYATGSNKHFLILSQRIKSTSCGEEIQAADLKLAVSNLHTCCSGFVFFFVCCLL